jgi:chromosome segregation protein
MYLKSLELLGFKSFASRTTLEFHRGVTAVVGPNGCGKSNVLDAIRWVLGEQSAKALRGGEMADVIFSGTDSRQALGMAEVSMTFADCEKDLGVDWHEVRITRRVFRDGKSEYLINKTPCRLRDIHELFMDTGIGRSAYSIMEQGKIDQILSSKPDDRRAIFEEAAGITKYKAQKREALRKLEHTEANLVRVADIIREVKRQIGSLQRQAGKARRYQNLSETLRIFDTHLSHKNYVALTSELEGIRTELVRLEEAKELHEQEIYTQEGEAISYRSQLGTLDGQIGEARERCQVLQNRIYSAENRIESHGHRMEELGDLIARNEGDIAGAREKTQEQENRLVQTDAQIEELLNTLRAGEESLRAREAAVRDMRQQRAEAERMLQDLGREQSNLEARISHLRNEKSSAQGRREATESRLGALQAEVISAGETAGQTASRCEEAAQRLLRLEENLRLVQVEIQQRQEELSVLRAEQAAALEAQKACEKSSAELASKLEILRRLEARGEGLGEGTQALLRGLDNPDFFLPAMAGSVAGRVDIEPQFIPALEAALGSDLQAVLFQDAEVAESAALTLAGGDHGRAHLVPRQWTRFESGEANQGWSVLPAGALAWAVDCVRGPAEVMAFLRPRLRGVVIVPDVSTALQLRREHAGLSFVSLHGEWVGEDGLLSAGKLGGGMSAAILRKREIATLEEEASVVARDLQAAVEGANAVADRLHQVESELAESRQEAQNLQVELGTARSEHQLWQRQLGESRQRGEQLTRELENLQAQLSETEVRLGDFDRQLEGLLAEQGQIQSRRAAAEAGVQDFRDRETGEIDLLNELRVRVATEREQRESLQRQREPMAARLSELAELIGQRSQDIENYRSRIAGLEAERSELSQSIGDWREQLQVAEAEGASLLSQRAELVETIEALETALRVARKTLADLVENRGKFEVKTTQIELRRENICEHITRRYQLDLAEFAPDPYALNKALKEHKLGGGSGEESAPESVLSAVDTIEASALASEDGGFSLPSTVAVPPANEGGIPWDEVQTIVASLTERLDSMGPVNLDAIQEFAELEERYQFLEQQNTDLANSKNELMEVISRINKTTKEMFAETFAKIRENFEEMFQELFGGGKANLLLVDESDPLESGIEIIAKPPGKQLQSVSLLSGGERTMTAVSLLFAIYMVKPSPFCVLDEMDAPLDESNISRFIKILDRFTGQSQFVVITHNKRTISRADMLYGVTMEEHGVSKLVGVRFHNREETGAATDRNTPSIAESFGKSGELAGAAAT